MAVPQLANSVHESPSPGSSGSPAAGDIGTWKEPGSQAAALQHKLGVNRPLPSVLQLRQ